MIYVIHLHCSLLDTLIGILLLMLLMNSYDCTGGRTLRRCCCRCSRSCSRCCLFVYRYSPPHCPRFSYTIFTHYRHSPARFGPLRRGIFSASRTPPRTHTTAYCHTHTHYTPPLRIFDLRTYTAPAYVRFVAFIARLLRWLRWICLHALRIWTFVFTGYIPPRCLVTCTPFPTPRYGSRLIYVCWISFTWILHSLISTVLHLHYTLPAVHRSRSSRCLATSFVVYFDSDVTCVPDWLFGYVTFALTGYPTRYHTSYVAVTRYTTTGDYVRCSFPVTHTHTHRTTGLPTYTLPFPTLRLAFPLPFYYDVVTLLLHCYGLRYGWVIVLRTHFLHVCRYCHSTTHCVTRVTTAFTTTTAPPLRTTRVTFALRTLFGSTVILPRSALYRCSFYRCYYVAVTFVTRCPLPGYVTYLVGVVVDYTVPLVTPTIPTFMTFTPRFRSVIVDTLLLPLIC